MLTRLAAVSRPRACAVSDFEHLPATSAHIAAAVARRYPMQSTHRFIGSPTPGVINPKSIRRARTPPVVVTDCIATGYVRLESRLMRSALAALAISSVAAWATGSQGPAAPFGHRPRRAAGDRDRCQWSRGAWSDGRCVPDLRKRPAASARTVHAGHGLTEPGDRPRYERQHGGRAICDGAQRRDATPRTAQADRSCQRPRLLQRAVRSRRLDERSQRVSSSKAV
jgi:hypothetical protein